MTKLQKPFYACGISPDDFAAICQADHWQKDTDFSAMLIELSAAHKQFTDHNLELSEGLSFGKLKEIAERVIVSSSKQRQALIAGYYIEDNDCYDENVGRWYLEFVPPHLEPLINSLMEAEKEAQVLLDGLPKNRNGKLKTAPRGGYAFQYLIGTLSQIFTKYTGMPAETEPSYGKDSFRPTEFQIFVKAYCVGFGGTEIIDTFESKVDDAMKSRQARTQPTVK